jgi:hypothetical protein
MGLLCPGKFTKMIGSYKLVLDTHSEVYSMIKKHADAIFWNLEQHIQKKQVLDKAIYVIGREQMRLHSDKIRNLINETGIKVVFSNPHEGSQTLVAHCHRYGIADLVLDKKIILVGGGNMDSAWPCLSYDSFLPKLLDYDENLAAMADYEHNYTTKRPYKFLMLNGRARSHRTELLKKFNNILDQGIWTNLDSAAGPIRLLPPYYEHAHVITHNNLPQSGFVKHHLFDNKWGDVYLKANLYLDTYFSVVTETVFDYPYSFRTEKIWKPIAIGHPWIAVANAGFYRDIRNLGFQTFEAVIDESFDQIDNNKDRLDRIAQVVKDLCQQDLASFVKECYNVCKYNQQHLAQMRNQVRQEFPERFFHFIRAHHFNE